MKSLDTGAHGAQHQPASAQPENAPVQAADREASARPGSLQASVDQSPRIQSQKRSIDQALGLPRQLKAGIESLSGMSMSDVQVHRNSSRPAALQAHAYAQGRDIHLGPQQEHHLPHEAWHVVQQAQGRVRPTLQMNGGVPVNDDAGLEHEADMMGARAMQLRLQPGANAAKHAGSPGRVVQRQPEIDNTDEAVGERIVDNMDRLNTAGSHDSGVHYAHNYERNAQRHESYRAFWKDDYRSGYASPEYFDRVALMTWKLKDGKSAAAAIKAWLKGPTIAECITSVYAAQTDALRASLGDRMFDYLYGTLPSSKPKNSDNEKILIAFPGNTYHDHMPISTVHSESGLAEGVRTKGDSDQTRGTMGNRPAKKGEWYYFTNHPKYLLKHPGGAFQGENALCMGTELGVQYWAGFGVSKCTEQEMMNTIAEAYNGARNDNDYRALVDMYGLGALKTGGKSYQTVYEENLDSIDDVYRHDKGHFVTTVSVNNILAEPAYLLGGTSRKGGFSPSAGVKVSAEKIKGIRQTAVLEQWQQDHSTGGLTDFAAASEEVPVKEREQWIQALVSLADNQWATRSTADLFGALQTIADAEVSNALWLRARSTLYPSQEAVQLRQKISALNLLLLQTLTARKLSFEVTNTKHGEALARNTFKLKCNGKESQGWTAHDGTLTLTATVGELIHPIMGYKHRCPIELTITEYRYLGNGVFKDVFNLLSLDTTATIKVDKFQVKIRDKQ